MVYAFGSVLLSTLFLYMMVGSLRAPADPGWTLLLGYLATSSLFTGICYGAKALGVEPEGLIDETGPLKALVPLIVLPYTALGMGIMLFERALSREPFADEVAPALWVGKAPLFWEGRDVHARKVTAVLNMCYEFHDTARLRRAQLQYRRLPVLDGTAPSLERLVAAVDWCVEQLDAGRTVLVHCAQGHGRSATVAAAVLLHRGHASSPEEAIRLMREARPRVRLSAHQRGVLESFHARREGATVPGLASA